MKVVETIAEMKKLRAELPAPLGFVPTMGYLHRGHLSLVEKSHEENQATAVSIFVNPTQFGPREDFKSYPRDTKRDLSLLEPLADVVFMPAAKEIYPKGYDTWVEVGSVTTMLEGAARPTHFRGVATVVAKLLNIVEPARAYFGQKDAQQVAVIRKMAADLNMNLEVVALPTVRESDGLAMSSRNGYLTPEQRQAAAVLYKSLMLAQSLQVKGEKNAGVIRQEMADLIRKEPLADIDYISIADNLTLEELHRLKVPALVSLAVRFGKTRLIDNIMLE